MTDPNPPSTPEQATTEGDDFEPGAPAAKTEWWHSVLGIVAIIASTFCCGNIFGWWGGSSVDGFGVTRAAVASPFQAAGCGFLPVADQRGFPCEEANGMNGMFRVTLVGPAEDLVYAGVTMDVARFVDPKQQEVVATGLLSLPVTLLKATTPDWPSEDAMRWIAKCTEESKSPQNHQFEHRTQKAVIRYRVSMQPYTITVSVESPEWK